MHKKVFTEFENSPRFKLFSKHFIRIWTKQTSNAVCCAMDIPIHRSCKV